MSQQTETPFADYEHLCYTSLAFNRVSNTSPAQPGESMKAQRAARKCGEFVNAFFMPSAHTQPGSHLTLFATLPIPRYYDVITT